MVDWDKRYGQSEAPMFGLEPNIWIMQTLARPDFSAGSALCLADGDGRNGRYLAGQGLDVTAVDLSRVATQRALDLDRAAGVNVERIAADLGHWQPDNARRWQSIFLIALHCECEVRKRAVELAARHLEPGGWFVAEGFAANYDDGPRMGPPDRSLLFDPAQFDRWLDGFEIFERLSGTIRLDEGTKHRGLAQVIRYLARKPLTATS